jgi:hypothetical protein
MDDEGCLLCHKYPKMGRITEEGARRSYYVLPHVFGKTVHRNVPCRDCHDYIKELPHQPVTKGVSCDTECHHVENPATGKPFSHKPIMEAYQESSHARTKVAEGLDADKPYCITCHTNPLYNPDEAHPPPEITDRCVICHEDEQFVDKWYNHTSRRIREVKRSSEEIVALCSSCHSDEQLIERHLDAAEQSGEPLGEKFAVSAKSYDESFHGKVTRYGYKEAANCLDCHADAENYYYSVHQIKPSRDPESPVHESNKLETCKRCHSYADENYVTLDPHPDHSKEANPAVYWFEEIYGWIGDSVLFALLGLAMFETVGRRRDGVAWRLMKGSSWRRISKRGRDRISK